MNTSLDDHGLLLLGIVPIQFPFRFGWDVAEDKYPLPNVHRTDGNLPPPPGWPLWSAPLPPRRGGQCQPAGVASTRRWRTCAGTSWRSACWPSSWRRRTPSTPTRRPPRSAVAAPSPPARGCRRSPWHPSVRDSNPLSPPGGGPAAPLFQAALPVGLWTLQWK